MHAKVWRMVFNIIAEFTFELDMLLSPLQILEILFSLVTLPQVGKALHRVVKRQMMYVSSKVVTYFGSGGLKRNTAFTAWLTRG